jgi:hypothetical protein
MMEATTTSEMSMNIYHATQYSNPDDSFFILAAVKTSNLTLE